MSMFAQEDTFSRTLVYELDTMTTANYPKKHTLYDSLSFFTIEGEKVFFSVKNDLYKKKYKGKVSRWKTSVNENGFEDVSFYIVSRGLGRVSLTVKMKGLSEDLIELHILNAWSTFDKKFIGHKTELSAINRSVFTKAKKPSRK